MEMCSVQALGPPNTSRSSEEKNDREHPHAEHAGCLLKFDNCRSCIGRRSAVNCRSWRKYNTQAFVSVSAGSRPSGEDEEVAKSSHWTARRADASTISALTP